MDRPVMLHFQCGFGCSRLSMWKMLARLGLAEYRFTLPNKSVQERTVAEAHRTRKRIACSRS